MHTPSDGSDSETVLAWLEKVKPVRAVVAWWCRGYRCAERLLKAAGVSEGLWVDHRCDLGWGLIIQNWNRLVLIVSIMRWRRALDWAAGGGV